MEKTALIHAAVEKLAAHPPSESVLVGFDGFVDEIIHVVATRQDAGRFTRIDTITDLGERIRAAAGLSANIEMVPLKVKLGGNGPIMANNLIAQGYPVHFIGALGRETVHPAFKEFSDGCASVISLCDAAHTDALEFSDGKIMLGKMDVLQQVNWDNLLAHLPASALAQRISQLGLIAITNWTMLPEMNGIITGFTRMLKQAPHRVKVFVDLADPAKRDAHDIAEVLALLKRMQEVADVVLGLNLNESMLIAEVLLHTSVDDLTTRAQAVRTALGIHQVVIHPTRSACAVWEGGEAFLEGPYTPTPKLTTGAGDNFNAGYCNGWLSGLTPEESLVAGVCSSGFYVRREHSANRQELIAFMHNWEEAGGGVLP